MERQGNQSVKERESVDSSGLKWDTPLPTTQLSETLFPHRAELHLHF